MGKKYQVFISSTYKDLSEERTKVTEILLSANCIPAGMEAFVATDDEQFNVIKKVIDICDYYILIIGNRYGSINPLTKKSYTEMEYEYAKSREIPVLVFSKEINNSSEKDKNLEDFRKKTMTNRLASVWKDKADLAGKVAVSIMKAIKENPRPGWQPATDFDEASLRRQIMVIQTENSELKQKIESLNKEIESFSQSGDLAFEEGIFKIEFTYSPDDYRLRFRKTIETNYKEIFVYIATDLIEVSLNEHGIKLSIINFIKSKVKNISNVKLTDPQIPKRILLQLKELNLIFSNSYYWKLTKNGINIRNKNILVQK